MRSQPALVPLLLGWLHVLSTGGVGSPAEHCPLSLGRVHPGQLHVYLAESPQLCAHPCLYSREGGWKESRWWWAGKGVRLSEHLGAGHGMGPS